MSLDACVIGGAGYLGCRLVRGMLAAGHRVRVLDNMTFGDASLAGLDVAITVGDATEPDVVRDAIAGADVVLATAGLIGDRVCELVPLRALHWNYELMRVVTDAIVEQPDTRLLFMSSGSVYGRQPREFADEDAEPRPSTVYAESRLLSDQYVMDRSGVINATVLRLGCLYGWSERMRFDLVVNRMTAAAVVDGEIEVEDVPTLRPLIHVDDVVAVAGLMMSLPGEQVGGRVFNVGSAGQCVTDMEVARIVQRVVPCEVRVESGDGEQEQYAIAFDRLADLGFTPGWSIEDGVRDIAGRMDAVEDYRSQHFYNLSAAGEDE